MGLCFQIKQTCPLNLFPNSVGQYLEQTVQGLLLIKEGKGICLVVAITSFSGWLSRHNSRFCKQFLIIIINKFGEGFLGGQPVAPKEIHKVKFSFLFLHSKLIFLSRIGKKFVSFPKLIPTFFYTFGWALLTSPNKLYLLA